MPLEPKHIVNFLENATNEKFSSELLDLLIKRINKLCFEECQIDRIQCTLTPLCMRRFLLKIRIKNGLSMDDLPKFCYSVQKNIVLRDFRGKTVVYKPFDAYLYLVDFLDIFFHGDYRKLNKFISFKNWNEALEIFDERIKKGEEFNYYLKENHMIFKFDDRIHVIFIEEKYVLCNANRENIATLNLLSAICEFYTKLYFPEVDVRLIPKQHVEVTTVLPKDIIKKISETPIMEDNPSKTDHYFWNVFHDDIEGMMKYCKEIHLNVDWNNNLLIKLCFNLETNDFNEDGKRIPLRFRDLRLMLNFVHRLYNDFYVIWL
ncbi:MAG: hypothetical protein EU539_00650 [Promethearchaeota archaeon]|nr:MAG: hypothetical protein EU539_00650 [Candidatus Lokiarchaeota archaeon]